MALLINQRVNIKGFTIDQLYIRTNLKLDFSGKRIHVRAVPYFSKDKFKEDPAGNAINIPLLFPEFAFDYDPSVNGDSLLYSQERLKEFLSTDIMEEVPVVDSSTGEYQYDPSTGELITQSVVKSTKFVEPSNITLVDFD